MDGTADTDGAGRASGASSAEETCNAAGAPNTGGTCNAGGASNTGGTCNAGGSCRAGEKDRGIVLLGSTEALSDDKGWALRRRSVTRYAGNNAQSSIIVALGKGICGIDALEDVVRSSNANDMRDDEASLAIAQFILEFGEFLKS